jgi:hypothetical protein
MQLENSYSNQKQAHRSGSSRILRKAIVSLLFASFSLAAVNAQTGSWSPAAFVDLATYSNGGFPMSLPAIAGPADTATAAWTKLDPSGANLLQIGQKLPGLNQWTITHTKISGALNPPRAPLASTSVAEQGSGPAAIAVGGKVISRPTATSAWSAATTLGVGDGLNPQAFLDANKNATVVFLQWSSACADYCDLAAATRPNGGAWSTKIVAYLDPGSRFSASVNSSGMAVIATLTARATATPVVSLMTRGSATAPWTTLQRVSKAAANYPAVAIDSTGTVTAAWVEFGAGLSVTRGIAGGISWSAPFVLDAAAFAPALTTIPTTGDVVMAWNSASGTNWLIQTSTLSSVSGKWSTPVTLNNPSLTKGVAYVTIATSADATFVAVGWVGGTGGKIAALFVALQDHTTQTWGTATQIDSGVNVLSGPIMTVGPGKTVTALWLMGNAYYLRGAIYK